uniref:Uncharacterized protein n=1 Tax=Anguilla anguilla TaxID=7936 RepID=A0A0E9T886_ANGAN
MQCTGFPPEKLLGPVASVF